MLKDNSIAGIPDNIESTKSKGGKLLKQWQKIVYRINSNMFH